ncbi:thioredoxin family protein [Cohnella candidum]|uniref:Thioredoxin family protein n=1 Tax=Cohnella candidum TaxID=2674991 RepID=A0A3G3JXC5_9BACL|nr:thioredoxin family protein [Cohnella candidum]AYQ72507.1 thioredoxin family protein [Cohnella candidum]
MTIRLPHKVGTGITPKQFMEGMQKNRERFEDIYRAFEWPNREDERYFRGFANAKNLQVLILCTDWCPDVIWNVPLLFRMLEDAGVPVEVLPMEEHLETMDLFLTDGGRNQPIVLFLDGEGTVLGKWGARPAYIQEVMNEFRRKNPDRTDPDYQEKVSRVRREIESIYRSTDYVSAVVTEVRQLIASFGV